MSAIRTTTLGSANSMLGLISESSSRYNELALEASSGLRVDEPSDDPVATQSIINTNTQLSKLNSYVSNMSTSQSEINIVDGAISSLTNSVQKAIDLATQTANGIYSATDLASSKDQIDSIISTSISVANTQFNGTYVFSGTATATQAYSMVKDATGAITSITYNGNQGERYTQISEGVSPSINQPGDSIFGSYSKTAVTAGFVAGDVNGTTTSTSVDANGNTVTTSITKLVSADGLSTTTTTEAKSGLLGNLVALSNALGSSDSQAINSNINNLNTDLDTIISARSNYASTSNTFTMTTNSVKANILTLKSYKSDLQDADVTQVYTDLATQKTALEATMQIASQVYQKVNLLDYL